jgi:transaldolase
MDVESYQPGSLGGAPERPEEVLEMTTSRLHELSAQGQSVWIDFLSRPLLKDGDLKRLIREDAVVGVTSNPTIFQKAISQGDAYDDQLREVLEEHEDAKEVFLELAVRDIQDACDVLRDTFERTDHLDGFVSIEVDPELAYDRDATIAEARRLREWVDRENVFIKIPATEPGLGAIEETIADGIAVNVTLIFGLERYRAVAEAYLRGLERLVESGGDPSTVPSVASFFVSRVDTEADKRLDEIGGHDELRGKLAIANAKLAYQAYHEIFAGDRWEKLKAAGARPQRCLWASTSVKDDRYRDTMYVEELIGRETVDTMPPETIEAFQDHGEVEPTLESDLDGAKKVFDDLRAAGIDYDDVIDTLEREGVEKFSDSFHQLLDDVKSKRDALAGART